MKKEKIEKMLRETIVAVIWSCLASLHLRMRNYEAAMEIMLTLVDFIKSYGTKQDYELLRKIPDLMKADAAKRRARKKEGISIDTEADEATKKWVGGLLKDIGRQLEK